MGATLRKYLVLHRVSLACRCTTADVHVSVLGNSICGEELFRLD